MMCGLKMLAIGIDGEADGRIGCVRDMVIRNYVRMLSFFLKVLN